MKNIIIKKTFTYIYKIIIIIIINKKTFNYIIKSGVIKVLK
jgi:hypothetical protein